MNTRGIKFIENVFYSLDSYLYMVCFFNSIVLFEQVCGFCFKSTLIYIYFSHQDMLNLELTTYYDKGPRFSQQETTTLMGGGGGGGLIEILIFPTYFHIFPFPPPPYL